MNLGIDVSRHLELFNPLEFKEPVHLVGVGATGSWIGLMLAKLGVQNVHYWDFDKVEEHNIANQAFGLPDVGKSKVHALEELTESQTKCKVTIHDEKVCNQKLTGIVFLLVDSMSERKKIFENCLQFNPLVKHVIEPRMGIDVGRVYNVNPSDINHVTPYLKTYYSDEEAEVSACGASMSVVTSALTIASWCVRQLIEFHNKEKIDNEILLDMKYNNIITYKW